MEEFVEVDEQFRQFFLERLSTQRAGFYRAIAHDVYRVFYSRIYCVFQLRYVLPNCGGHRLLHRVLRGIAHIAFENGRGEIYDSFYVFRAFVRRAFPPFGS